MYLVLVMSFGDTRDLMLVDSDLTNHIFDRATYQARDLMFNKRLIIRS